MAGEFTPTTNVENSQENNKELIEGALIGLETGINKSEGFVGEMGKERVEVYDTAEAGEKIVGDAQVVLKSGFNTWQNGNKAEGMNQLREGLVLLKGMQNISAESKGKPDEIKSNTEVIYNELQDAGIKMDEVTAHMPAESSTTEMAA